MIIISRSSSKEDHVGSKTRSLGQISEKPCVHSRGHSFDSKVMKLNQMLMIIISRSDLKLGHVKSKTRSPGQILEKPCVHSRGHRFDRKFTKLRQNVNHLNVYVRFETGSCWVKN